MQRHWPLSSSSSLCSNGINPRALDDEWELGTPTHVRDPACTQAANALPSAGVVKRPTLACSQATRHEIERAPGQHLSRRRLACESRYPLCCRGLGRARRSASGDVGKIWAIRKDRSFSADDGWAARAWSKVKSRSEALRTRTVLARTAAAADWSVCERGLCGPCCPLALCLLLTVQSLVLGGFSRASY